MIAINVTFSGDPKKDVAPFIKNLAFAIEAEMKRLMTLPKHGRAYKRGDKTHIASRPGEAPAVDTSFLINSISVPESKITDTSATIIIPAEYAEALEFGTNRIKARPFVRPAIAGVLKRVGKGGILQSARE